MSKIILLINPLSATQYISQELKARGFFTIALFTITRNAIPAYFQPSLDLFDQQIYLDNPDIKQLITAVAKYKIDFIINGSDESLLTTERIIDQLLPQYSNDKAMIPYRINKFYMQEAFKKHGLPYIKQLKIAPEHDELAASEINKTIGFPCFIKPVRGAASIGASFCESYSKLVKQLKTQLYSATNHLMDEYIVQEIIDGDEIFVDTFSINGQHYVSSVQTISKEKIGSISCYRTETLIYDKPLWHQAAVLVKKALDACGIRNGFSHVELFHLKDGSFRIIEINPRHSGAKGLCNALPMYHGLHTQIDLLTDYLQGKKILESQPEAIKGYGKLLFLYSFSQTPIKDILPTLSSFNSIVKVVPCSTPGTISPPIKNLGNVDCMLILYDKYDKQHVINEAKQIRQLEMAGKLF